MAVVGMHVKQKDGHICFVTGPTNGISHLEISKVSQPSGSGRPLHANVVVVVDMVVVVVVVVVVAVIVVVDVVHLSQSTGQRCTTSRPMIGFVQSSLVCLSHHAVSS